MKRQWITVFQINQNIKPHSQEAKVRQNKYKENNILEISENYQESKELGRQKQKLEKENQIPGETIIQTEGTIKTFQGQEKKSEKITKYMLRAEMNERGERTIKRMEKINFGSLKTLILLIKTQQN